GVAPRRVDRADLQRATTAEAQREAAQRPAAPVAPHDRDPHLPTGRKQRIAARSPVDAGGECPTSHLRSGHCERARPAAVVHEHAAAQAAGRSLQLEGRPELRRGTEGGGEERDHEASVTQPRAGNVVHVNRLAEETSPYLLQHAENPVDWYAWGDEAFE